MGVVAPRLKARGVPFVVSMDLSARMAAGAGGLAVAGDEEWLPFAEGSFDLVVALSPTSQRQALEMARTASLDVEYWPILDPTGLGESREAKLSAYRQARDQIRARMVDRFGPPTVEGESA